MKRILLLTVLATFGSFLASCVDRNTTSPLSGGTQGLPQDDGKVFDPNTPSGDPVSSAPVVPPSSGNAGNNGGGGQGGGGGPGNPNGPVPEPMTLLVFGSGLAGIAVMRRRRRPAA